jgi:small multidrug resistance family-3 protein
LQFVFFCQLRFNCFSTCGFGSDTEEGDERDMNLLAWLIFLGAAILEVGGDATVRRGLRGSNLALIIGGFVALGCYGLVVNSVKWEFSRLIGVYVAFFALVSVLAGRFYFKEAISLSTWCGLALIIAGGLVIQFGHH